MTFPPPSDTETEDSPGVPSAPHKLLKFPPTPTPLPSASAAVTIPCTPCHAHSSPWGLFIPSACLRSTPPSPCSYSAPGSKLRSKPFSPSHPYPSTLLARTLNLDPQVVSLGRDPAVPALPPFCRYVQPLPPRPPISPKAQSPPLPTHCPSLLLPSPQAHPAALLSLPPASFRTSHPSSPPPLCPPCYCVCPSGPTQGPRCPTPSSLPSCSSLALHPHSPTPVFSAVGQAPW